MKQRKLVPNVPLPDFKNRKPSSAAANAASDAHVVTPQPASTPAATTPIEKDIRSIPVGLIDPNPFPPRQVYTPAMIRKRADDLASQGQHDPIHVIPNPAAPGRFIIADGWTRVLGCTTHKVLDELQAEVHHDMSLVQAAWFGYQQNEGREQHRDIDRAQFYESMIAETGREAQDIALEAGISPQLMSMYRAYAKLPEEVMEIMLQNPDKFTANAAAQLLKLCKTDDGSSKAAVALAAKFSDEDQTIRWLISQVQSKLSTKPRNGKSPLKHVRYANGYFKQRKDGFEVSISVPAEKQEEFGIELEKLLDKVAVKETSKGGTDA